MCFCRDRFVQKSFTVLFDGMNLTVLWKGFRYLLKNGNVTVFLPSWIINHRERIRIAILISIKTRHPYIWEHKRKQLIYIYIFFLFLKEFPVYKFPAIVGSKGGKMYPTFSLSAERLYAWLEHVTNRSKVGFFSWLNKTDQMLRKWIGLLGFLCMNFGAFNLFLVFIYHSDTQSNSIFDGDLCLLFFIWNSAGQFIVSVRIYRLVFVNWTIKLWS